MSGVSHTPLVDELRAKAWQSSRRGRSAHGHVCYRAADTITELLAACESAIPKGVCLTNRNIPDDFTVALDCTMGDLRKLAAAIAKARGGSDDQG